jgi:Predicted thioesterase involved in non-ribosomal peptide biosynthesis
MEPLVHALAEAIEPYINSPYALFGHSMGGVVAFELCRELRRRERPLPRTLIAASARAPRFRRGHIPQPDPTDAELIADLARLEGTPPEVLNNPDLLRVLLPALRADTILYRNYVYTEEPPLPIAIHACGGLSDPNVTAAHLEPWSEETTLSFDVAQFPGGHFFLQSALEFFPYLSSHLK